MQREPGLTAVIDIGSNSVRMVIYRSQDGRLLTEENSKYICRLGDFDLAGNMKPENMQMAFDALEHFRATLENAKIKTTIAVATAAARSAGNGTAFIKKAEKILAAPVDVLSAEDEAVMAARGVIWAANYKARFFSSETDKQVCKKQVTGIVADLGGGSLELAKVEDDHIQQGLSLPLGTLILQAAEQPEALIAKSLGALPEEFLQTGTLYVIGGSWRAIKKTWEEDHQFDSSDALITCIPAEAACVHLKKLISLRAAAHNTAIDNSESRHIYPEGLNDEARGVFKQYDCLCPDRANRIFDAGLLMLELIKVSNAQQTCFVEAGLREGLLYTYLQAAPGFPSADR